LEIGIEMIVGWDYELIVLAESGGCFLVSGAMWILIMYQRPREMHFGQAVFRVPDLITLAHWRNEVDTNVPEAMRDALWCGRVPCSGFDYMEGSQRLAWSVAVDGT
jgi:hypothetical protein